MNRSSWLLTAWPSFVCARRVHCIYHPGCRLEIKDMYHAATRTYTPGRLETPRASAAPAAHSTASHSRVSACASHDANVYVSYILRQ